MKQFRILPTVYRTVGTAKILPDAGQNATTSIIRDEINTEYEEYYQKIVNEIVERITTAHTKLEANEYVFREIPTPEELSEEIVQVEDDSFEIRVPVHFYRMRGAVNWEAPKTPAGCCPPYINAHCKCNWWKDEYCDFCVEDYLDDGQDTSYTEQ